jgi:3-methylfumaryl-CoA hydratase
MLDYSEFIGREQVLSETLSPDLCTRLAVTLGQSMPAEPAFGDPAPLASYLLICLPTPEEGDLGADGLPMSDAFLPPVDLPRRVWGGSKITIGEGFKVGQKVVRRGRITDIYEKRGRSGRMVFVEADFRFEADGALCLREELRQIYLEEREGGEITPAQPPRGPLEGEEFCFSPHQMFRFAAITFNAHRIHFDADYARRQEGYQDLVVQGPLMTLAILSDLQATLKAPIQQIELRGYGFAYVNEPLHIIAPSAYERHLCNRAGEILVTARAAV